LPAQNRGEAEGTQTEQTAAADDINPVGTYDCDVCVIGAAFPVGRCVFSG
jgi:hypothetical protein